MKYIKIFNKYVKQYTHVLVSVTLVMYPNSQLLININLGGGECRQQADSSAHS